jgi:hypothetical protein
MPDASDIESKISQAVTAQEAGDYATALTYLRSARMLMASVPEAGFGGATIRYSLADLDSMIRDMEVQRRRAAGAGQVRRTRVYYKPVEGEDESC